MQGKLGLSSLGQIVADLLKKVGYDNTMYDTSRLTDIVSGFIVGADLDKDNYLGWRNGKKTL